MHDMCCLLDVHDVLTRGSHGCARQNQKISWKSRNFRERENDPMNAYHLRGQIEPESPSLAGKTRCPHCVCFELKAHANVFINTLVPVRSTPYTSNGGSQ